MAWPISGLFGQTDPVYPDDGHKGIDFGVPSGTELRSPVPGVVVHAGPMGGYGNAVEIRRDDGRTVLLGHLDSIGIAAGAIVKPGTPIGKSGNTGKSTAPHLHLETRHPDGTPYNPENEAPAKLWSGIISGSVKDFQGVLDTVGGDGISAGIADIASGVGGAADSIAENIIPGYKEGKEAAGALADLGKFVASKRFPVLVLGLGITFAGVVGLMMAAGKEASKGIIGDVTKDLAPKPAPAPRSVSPEAGATKKTVVVYRNSKSRSKKPTPINSKSKGAA